MPVSLTDLSLLKSQAYINGQWVEEASGETFSVSNPANGLVLADVANMGPLEVRSAIEAAEQGMVTWQAYSPKQRCDILEAWHDLIMENQEDLAILLTSEQGKTLAESKGEIAYGASYVKWFSEEGKRVYGDILPQTPDRRGLVIKQPVGVVAGITPWNFPCAMITRKVAPALAAGCAFVLKPASQTPLSALALAELSRRVGLPAGVFNVVPSANASAIGKEMTSHPAVKKITFTGSTPIGKSLMQQSAETVKRTSLELGGNAPVMVFDDANLNMAVEGVIAAKFRNSGQTCICANRILVQENIHDQFITALKKKVNEFKLGDGLKDDTTLGPVISEKAANEVHEKVKRAIEAGAELIFGGKISDKGSHFYEPTILTNVNDSMSVFKEEIFGPVAPIIKFKTEEEALALANNTEFGLASYFFTEDIGRIFRVSEGLEYGMVGVNETAISSEVIPFGGIKHSGHGREGSKYGLDDYLNIKYVCLGGLN